MEPEDLRAALVDRFGDEPNFEVTYNRYPSLIPGSYGFYVHYDRGGLSMAEVRQAVEELSPKHTVILNERA